MVKYKLLLRLPFRHISVKIFAGRKMNGIANIPVVIFRTVRSKTGNHLRAQSDESYYSNDKA